MVLSLADATVATEQSVAGCVSGRMSKGRPGHTFRKLVTADAEGADNLLKPVLYVEAVCLGVVFNHHVRTGFMGDTQCMLSCDRNML